MNDTIRREAVIATIAVMYERCDTKDITDYRDLLLESVEALPTADRPQAEWRDLDGNFVPLDENGCPTASVFCSNCGEWLTASDEYYTTGRFCPNCGYRMRKGKDET